MNIYDFKVKNIENEDVSLSDYKGKVLLIVNTATGCGFTPQYEGLEAIYEKYKDQNFEILDFPCNQFLNQAPGTNEEIGAFCQKNYGVTFPISAKVSVKGDDTAPIFKYLTDKNLNGVKNTTILWNFTKFLVDENGKLIDSFISTTKPTDEAITKYFK